jgi:hypothetical protein
MPTVDQYISPVDVKDSHVLTRLVERQVRESDIYNIPFAPIRGTMSRKVMVRVSHIDGSGLAKFKADNADTPIVSGSGGVTEIFMELFAIAEKEVLKASDMIALRSPDPLVANTAAADLVRKAARLRQRNVNRTKWMAWQAAKDDLSVAYPDGTAIKVDYDLDGDTYNNWFSTSHLPTASTTWAAAATDIITDVYDWTYIIAEDLGIAQEQCVMYCSSKVLRYLLANTGVKAQLSTYQPRIITPTMAEVANILGISAIRVYNDFYVAESSQTKSKFLDDGHVLITAPDSVNGTPLAEVLDGPVARVVGNDIVVESNPGALAEIYLNAEQVAQNVRVQTARLPQINYPAGILYADIVP